MQQKKQHLLKNLMQNIPDRIYFKDLKGAFIQTNNALAARFGLERPENAEGKTDFDFSESEPSSEAYKDEQEIIRSGKPIVNKQEKECWPGGDITWASTTKESLRNSKGRIMGTFGISRDITSFKEATDRQTEAHQQPREEIEYAKQVHKALLPEQTPEYPGVEFGLRFVPSESIGGDFIDFVKGRSENRFGVVFADITGHGTGAALCP